MPEYFRQGTDIWWGGHDNYYLHTFIFYVHVHYHHLYVYKRAYQHIMTVILRSLKVYTNVQVYD